ncbi:probable glutathione S-transferase 7 [Watersipora subatra]|uniref:probable glutathione S-transferase 7 n=1 Tax=Watersipora subatra TaxID=2589382 RepID=UPI00355ADE95
MNCLYSLLLLLVTACTAEIIGRECIDSSALCTIRKDDCMLETIKVVCPATCGECSRTPIKDKVYNLTYFDLTIRSRGEQIRWILEQGDAKWIDTRVPIAAWGALKPKTLTGHLPYLEVEGRTIAESGAIALYLGRELGLAGRDNWETAEVHMLWDMTQDAFNEIVNLAFVQDAVAKAAGLKKFHEQSLPFLLNFIATRLSSGQEWLVGNKLTLADIVVAHLYDFQVGKAKELIKNSSLNAALYDRVVALPKIKHWLDTRPPSP